MLNLDPNHVNAVFARAACQNKKGDYSKAIEDYNRALELDCEKQILLNNQNKRSRRLLANRIQKEKESTTQSFYQESNKKLALQQTQAQNMRMHAGGEDDPDFINPNESNMNMLYMDTSQIINNQNNNNTNAKAADFSRKSKQPSTQFFSKDIRSALSGSVAYNQGGNQGDDLELNKCK